MEVHRFFFLGLHTRRALYLTQQLILEEMKLLPDEKSRGLIINFTTKSTATQYWNSHDFGSRGPVIQKIVLPKSAT